MPTIQLKFSLKKKKYTKKTNNENHAFVYNTRIWRILRLQYLTKNPLCERCKKMEKLSLAIDVHHIIPISTGKTREAKQRLGYDINNLMALCEECHKYIHRNDNDK
jgi:5-methylcytosine-specific restriction protein A